MILFCWKHRISMRAGTNKNVKEFILMSFSTSKDLAETRDTCQWWSSCLCLCFTFLFCWYYGVNLSIIFIFGILIKFFFWKQMFLNWGHVLSWSPVDQYFSNCGVGTPVGRKDISPFCTEIVQYCHKWNPSLHHLWFFTFDKIMVAHCVIFFLFIQMLYKPPPS